VIGKFGTWAAAGGTAGGIVAAGVAVGRRRDAVPGAAVAAVAVAGAYLTGTFAPRSRIFGAPVATTTTHDEFALTFDDGPDPRHTPTIARLLAERGHRATFFVLGRAVREHPDVAAELVELGHELACHGDDHRLLAFASPGELVRQLTATETAVARATGRLPAPLFRAPHGVRSPWLTRVAAGRGYGVCAWDGSVFDTAEPGAATIAARVARLLRRGAVILLHDGDGSGRGASRLQTVEALRAILDHAEQRGLRSVLLSSLVRPPVATTATTVVPLRLAGA
jgi:peptidoglycan/xylan/chitin deacetylase (PgdA/CDA1 family)